MDIKLRNIKYAAGSKIVAVILLWVAFTGLFASMVFAERYSGVLAKKNYYETSSFLNEFNQHVYYALEYGVRLRSEEYIKAGNTIPADKKRNENQLQEKAALEKAAAEKLNELPQGSLDIKEKQDLIENDLQRFWGARRVLESSVNFNYLVIIRETGAVITNMNMEGSFDPEKAMSELKAQKVYLYLSEKEDKFSLIAFSHLYADGLKKSFDGTPFEFYAAVKSPLSQGDAFYEYEHDFKTAHGMLPFFIIVAAASFLVGLCCFLYLVATAGRKEKGGSIRLAFIDRLYNDVHAGLVLLAAVVSLIIFYENNSWDLVYWDINKSIVISAGLFILLSVDLLIGLSYILSVVRHIRNKSLLRHTLVYTVARRVYGFVQLCFHAKTFKFTVLLLLLAYGLLNSVFFTVFLLRHGASRVLAFWILAAINIAALYFVSRTLISFSGILEWVKGISKGNLERTIDTRGMSAAFAELVFDIRNIQAGLKHAVSDAVKGERLKAELITNVSHDLKTPLTSILNYVDLLKNENPESETMKSHIEILDEKAKRLKQLIDDLLEASKAASGNVAVNFEKVDLPSLVQQAMAEFNDRAAEADLEIRIKGVENPPAVWGDGRLMWRVMENLLSNVVKYSQRSSRVYVDIENTGPYGVITIKNISANALDIPADQLMERFIRGDRSRTTEGSGLGLSIARSLAEIQGGKLDVTIDGDLFKVSVAIPRAAEDRG